MLEFEWLGLKDYEEALKIQFQFAERARETQKGFILACEHPAVVTLGKRGAAINDILVSMETLRQNKIKIVDTDRGGQATLHNPGQLVVYPILPLKSWGIRVRDYVECLETTTALYLAERGIEATRSYEPGLWVNDKKIAAFGIRINRGISLHGLAINVCNNLAPFSWIRLCGQQVCATNLSLEMAEFMKMDDAFVWNLQEEAKTWFGLFKDSFANGFEGPLSVSSI